MDKYIDMAKDKQAVVNMVLELDAAIERSEDLTPIVGKLKVEKQIMKARMVWQRIAKYFLSKRNQARQRLYNAKQRRIRAAQN